MLSPIGHWDMKLYLLITIVLIPWHTILALAVYIIKLQVLSKLIIQWAQDKILLNGVFFLLY